MSRKPYKLSTEIFGHTGDVRAIASFSDGTVVSTSRDTTTRVWKPTGNGTQYVESAVLKGHTKFVCSVCVINPCGRYPEGFIITGSNDNTICVYKANELKPQHVVQAHKDAVCNLRAGAEEGTFLSSSWDCTAKLWNISDLNNPRVTLDGHTAAVWCVANLSNRNIVTGSADKLVIIWTELGSIQHKLQEHGDCVRDIACIKDDEFLTCANDATVRHWNASLGTCLGTYYGHENYIYSIAATLNGTYVFTSGEDRTLRIWYNGEIDQTIILPPQSIWCVNLLATGDIVAGSSDGVVRIFSMDPARQADSKTMEKFEKEVASSSANQQLGGMNVKDIPDSEALQQPGQRDGQTKIVNDGGTVKAYSWSQSEKKWTLVGDVMGASGGTNATSGKQLYNGIEYDYVFSVDIKDGEPPLKLPYNNGQDPWHTAQKFLSDNDLSQLYLDQVARFIIKNSQPTPVLNSGTQYTDPFTGGNRYIPESGTSAISVEGPSHALPNSSSNTSTTMSYIPQTKYLRLEQANAPAILEKLCELNSSQSPLHKIRQEMIDEIAELLIHKKINTGAISTLKMLLKWPDNTVFPVLDIARLAVLYKEVNEELCTAEILRIVQKYIKSDALPSNQMLTFRLVANMFCHEKGERLCLDYRDEILKSLIDLESLGNKNNQVAMTTYILNLIIALNKHNDTHGRTKTLNVLFTVLPRLNESEAIFRALVGLGTLLATTPDTEDRNELIKAVLQSESTLNILKTMPEKTVDANIQNKLLNCSKQIIDLII